MLALNALMRELRPTDLLPTAGDRHDSDLHEFGEISFITKGHSGSQERPTRG